MTQGKTTPWKHETLVLVMKRLIINCVRQTYSLGQPLTKSRVLLKSLLI